MKTSLANTRVQKFMQMEKHPVLGKLFKKLTEEEYDMALQFVMNNSGLGDNDYMHLANRWFLDGNKPKHHTDMWAIVTQCK